MVGVVDDDVAEHVRVSSNELVVDAVGDVGDREPTLLFGDDGVELDLVEQVAELLDQVVVDARIVGALRVGERLQRIDDLVGLLEQIRDQRLDGSVRCPTGHCSRSVRVRSWKRT